MRHLSRTIDHDAGVVDLRTNDPHHLEAAAQAFHAFAFAGSSAMACCAPAVCPCRCGRQLLRRVEPSASVAHGPRTQTAAGIARVSRKPRTRRPIS